MQQNSKIYYGFLLVAFILQASHAASVSSKSQPPHRLLCYICANCAEISQSTPLRVCDEAYFNQFSTTEAPVSETTIQTTEELTTTPATTASSTSASSTTEEEPTTTTGSTVPPIPTAPTVGPAQTTTPGPTPPNVGTVSTILLDSLNETDISSNSTDSLQSMSLTLVSDYSYHCYSAQKLVNGSMHTERGCSRVTTMESVCGQLEAQNDAKKISHCQACTNTLCNSSSSLTVSAVALALALLAALLDRN